MIQSERQLRHSSSKQTKSEIFQLNNLVELEKTNLSQKVTAELDFTLKKAVKEKLELKKEIEIVVESKTKL